MPTTPSTFPRRPPRLQNIFTTTPLYFVTFCTHSRQALLASDDIHNAFKVSALKVNTAGNGVGRYVIMPDHIHVFVRIGLNGKLGLAVKCLREGITKFVHIQHPDIRVWQPGYFDHVVRSSENYSEKWAYVRDNPVRAGLVNKAEEWRFQGEIVALSF